MNNIFDIFFLIGAAVLCAYISYVMFSSGVINYAVGGVVFVNISLWSAMKAIDRHHGDTANTVDLMQDLSYFLGFCVFAFYVFINERR